jgi:dipicolinate synthase subunit A
LILVIKYSITLLIRGIDMNKNIKLALLGGDARQGCLARFLADRGYETATWGMSDSGCIGSAVRCRDPLSAMVSASAVILPLPATLDGVTLNSENEERIKLNAILEYAEVPFFGGRLSESFRLAASARKRKVIDYFESESLQIKNALPTAEGAISIAMQNLSKTLVGARAAVVGYGRIGKTLADLLVRIGAHVTVAARNELQLAYAQNSGAKALRILEPFSLDSDYDVIFNTVPAKLFDAERLNCLRENTLLIDLSSPPGGVDFAAAKQVGIRAIWALSLPGKYAPEDAGRIIGETLLELFEREGIT